MYIYIYVCTSDRHARRRVPRRDELPLPHLQRRGENDDGDDSNDNDSNNDDNNDNNNDSNNANNVDLRIMIIIMMTMIIITYELPVPHLQRRGSTTTHYRIM